MSATLTTRERFVRTLTGQETDRVPFMKVFGGTNAVLRTWKAQYPHCSRYVDELLQFEGVYRGWQETGVNVRLCGLPEDRVIYEDDAILRILRGDGAIEVHRKQGDYHAAVERYPVVTREDWDRIKSSYLDPDAPGRIPTDWDKYAELYAQRDYPLQLTHGGVYGFLRTMMGDENLCYAFYDDPELVHDIVDSYTSLCLRIWEKMARNVQFDLIECWEDMASKTGSIISPATFEEFLAPAFRRIRAFADAHKIPLVLVDSDGNIDQLAHQMTAAGVNAMYPFEVGAGCRVLDVLDRLPGLGAIGCLEKNAAALGEAAVDEQMEIARTLIRHGRCIPGPDHFVLENVSFDQYCYFMRRLREVVLTTKPGS